MSNKPSLVDFEKATLKKILGDIYDEQIKSYKKSASINKKTTIMTKDSVEYIFLSNSLESARSDMEAINNNAKIMTAEACYKMMCKMEEIKDLINNFEENAKIRLDQLEK